MYVIGTAGHVDHGKSTLVQALTGIDPDRLAEEKARQMTIDLGFAWLTLDGLAEPVGVIDVPGHRDFIENMLAGVGGIDLALLVIAADEGVMPQTREHLAILDLLAVQAGLVVITKADLIDDPDWLELIRLDIDEALAGSSLAGAPRVVVSARRGDGLAALRQAIVTALHAAQPPRDIDRPRLPVDRAFTLSGFGTVVTGTLLDGSLRLGDELTLLPDGLSGRVRGLQLHKAAVSVAPPGNRVAVNLSGVERAAVRRGMLLCRPEQLRPTTLLDATYRHLPDADEPLRHNRTVKLFLGAAEVSARTRILGQEQIAPGASGFVQFALSAPLAVVRGDRFIVRRPSPAATLGGGHILDAAPGRQHRRFRPATLTRLQTLAQGTPAELLLQALARHEPAERDGLLRAAGLDADSGLQALATLQVERQIVAVGRQWVTAASWRRWQTQIAQALAEYHTHNPLRPGMPREALRSKLGLAAPLFGAVVEALVDAQQIVEHGTLLRAAAHAVRFTPAQQQHIDALLATLLAAGINTPSVKQCQAQIGDGLYQALIDLEQLVAVNSDVVWPAATYETLLATVNAYLHNHDTITAAEVRDLFQTSRKYAIALLEHLDARRITRRVGDARALIRRAD